MSLGVVRRRAWVAAVLALVMPGLGDVYLRRVRRGVVVFALSEVAGAGVWGLTAAMAPTPGAVLAVLGVALAGVVAFQVVPAVAAARWARRVGAVARVRWWRSTWVALVVMLVVGEGGDAAFFGLRWGTFNIPSGSMEPTLMVGDYLVADERGAALAGVTPGDVVVFRIADGTDYVKRVLAVEGDSVRMVRGRIVVNGAMLPMVDLGGEAGVRRVRVTLPNGRSHIAWKREGENPLDNTREFHVPAGHVFMMGDNMDDSLDSRVAGGPVGMVPVERMVGVARTIYWRRGAGLGFVPVN